MINLTVPLSTEQMYISGNASLTASELSKCSAFFNNMVCSQNYFIILAGFGILIFILSILKFTKNTKLQIALTATAHLLSVLFFGVFALKYLHLFKGSFQFIKFGIYFVIGIIALILWKKLKLNYKENV